MKTGQRVYARYPLGRSGTNVRQGDRGTVEEVKRGGTHTVRTGFGPERRKSPDRVRIRWDNGESGWHSSEDIEK